MIKEINRCRICGGQDLIPVVNLGLFSFTGIFPKKENQTISTGPLELVRCNDEQNTNSCGLLQLHHSFDPNELYGHDYGYRSGLNRSMILHLQDIVKKIEKIVELNEGDVVLDIGSNDGSLLSFYSEIKGLILVGVDPTGEKFKEFYQRRIILIPKFFNTELIKENFGKKKIKVITTISMFYDLENPMQFMEEIIEVLADDGIWVMEQSYMPTMLNVTAYDTICHEHLEYYGLKQIKWMADRVGVKIISISLNDTNGGSFCVILAKKTANFSEATIEINKLLLSEQKIGLDTEKPYQDFSGRILDHKKLLLDFFDKTQKKNQLVLGYGASTKGNVILQHCGLGKKDIPFIAEINPDKFGSFTPGTRIPIISEKEAHGMNPDYFFILPWHFREGIIEKEQIFLQHGGKLVFPLPEFKIISKNDQE
ncbi:MAG: methyltransferase [Chloroflexi bacterium HGW-Chloroflexi-2]|jgi:hypothetical protein|nr:MAG: methyltransferase [Chloroflexi bacterium HGW-Chloroflexi-2]